MKTPDLYHVHPRSDRKPWNSAKPRPYRPLFSTTGTNRQRRKVPTQPAIVDWRSAEHRAIGEQAFGRKCCGRNGVQKQMRQALGVTRRQLDKVRGLVRRGQAEDLVAALAVIRGAA